MKDHKEIEKAKHAVIDFVHEAFWPKKEFGGENFNNCYLKLGEFSVLHPSPNSRYNGQNPLDFVSPSFWHACCSVLQNWVSSRMCFNDKPENILVYRGQTNPWPVTPSLWRNGFKKRNLEYLDIIKSYILPNSIAEPHPTYEFFDSFLTPEGFAGLGQHYGFPTTLIDISFSPLVALYFSSRDSQRQEFDQSQLIGHGVIFEGSYENLEILSRRSKVIIDHTLLPPMHVPRLYQQQGFFLNCSKLNSSDELAEIELAFRRIYFPREYPVMKDTQEVFSDNLIIKHLEYNPLYMLSPQANRAEKEWYLSLFGYSKMLSELEEIMSTNVDFDKKQILELIRHHLTEHPLPWHSHHKSAGTPYTNAIAYAETHSKVAEFIIRVARVHTLDGPRLNENIVRYYARDNKLLFESLFTSSSNLDILSLQEFTSEIKSVRNIEEMVVDTLSPEQKAKLENLISLS